MDAEKALKNLKNVKQNLLDIHSCLATFVEELEGLSARLDEFNLVDFDEARGLVQELSDEVSPLLERESDRKVKAEIRRNEGGSPQE